MLQCVLQLQNWLFSNLKLELQSSTYVLKGERMFQVLSFAVKSGTGYLGNHVRGEKGSFFSPSFLGLPLMSIVTKVDTMVAFMWLWMALAPFDCSAKMVEGLTVMYLIQMSGSDLDFLSSMTLIVIGAF